ncbi:DUF2958 domain-containing protein [Sphingomonas sp. Ag1]|jgi:hypothetical protein|uniref:DUF2958 domain-containing protein n=1 Tax=Sphingomonas sp. Ag1 TaxID=1642949 RepID=UPI0006222B55|nr:DUF2958 domain-containing protein [Sphingomonas sp. Ag1]KKI18199.1 hypothetical protein XM50_18955 [Sphingomonas sp. Ag1]
MEWIAMLGTEGVQQLIANGKEQAPLKGSRRERDFEPVCKIFLPWTSGTWLLTELDDDGLAFGLADMGYPELGYISLDEIWDVVGPGGLRVERDIHFTATKTLSEYAAEARAAGRITA